LNGPRPRFEDTVFAREIDGAKGTEYLLLTIFDDTHVPWDCVFMYGGESPVMEVIALLANHDFETKKQIAKVLAGITS
jgi:aromatic ring hydroxylase